jgi:hypothetical protein
MESINEDDEKKLDDSNIDYKHDKNIDKSKIDFNSEELLKILSGDEDFHDDGELKLEKSSNKFLAALQRAIPTSDNIADIASYKVTPVAIENFSSEFDDSCSVDLNSVAAMRNARISATSSICNYNGCNNNHFNHSGFCMLHDNKAADNEEELFYSRFYSLRNSLEEDLFYKGPFVDIDGKQVKLDTIYNMKAKILRKQSLMKAITVEREDNFSQLRNQFNKLDIDNDGVVSISDLKFMINKVDPSYVLTVKDDVLDEKCKQMIKETVIRSNAKEITYDVSLILLLLLI